jgi:hypothetical protein
MTWPPYTLWKLPCCDCCSVAVFSPAVFSPVVLHVSPVLGPGAACITTGGKYADWVVFNDGLRVGACCGLG